MPEQQKTTTPANTNPPPDKENPKQLTSEPKPGGNKMETASSFKFDVEKVRAHLGKIEEEVNKQQGKKGLNPFLWLRDEVNPLIERFTKGERTPELEGAILSLPEVPPKPNDGRGVQRDDAPTTQDITQSPPSPGLNLKNRLQ